MASLDDNVGRLLKAIRDLNLEENTLVMFISDNGGSLPYGGDNQPLRGEKADLFEGGIRVPCLMQWKGRLKPGTTTHQVAGGVDIFPTLSALASAPAAAEHTDGRDLSPVLFNGGRFERELFWRTGRANAYLLGYWKYIRTSDGKEFLFDLEHDPNERVNRIDDAAKLQQLRLGYQRLAATLPG